MMTLARALMRTSAACGNQDDFAIHFMNFAPAIWPA
jgi:hypothetical protein